MKDILHFVDLKFEVPELHKDIYFNYSDHWLETNTTSWYKVSTDSWGCSGVQKRGISISVGFEDEKEAIHFKLVWIDASSTV